MADAPGKLLNQTYGGYFHSQVPNEDESMTHVGPGTPGGEYLRRFWHPIAIEADIKDLPVALRILGEDLVIFRDGEGRLGLLERHCAHRGASLEFGRIQERGIRCCYHGWQYDIDGTILDMPGEPPTSSYRGKFCHGAYPLRAFHGVVFAYMGPPDQMPEFPVYDVFRLPELQPIPWANFVMPCNWLQIQDNIMDPAHLIFLHTKISGAQFTEAYGLLSQTEWYETSNGMVYVDTRRVGENVWVHICDQILPNVNQFPPLKEDGKAVKIFERPIQTNWAVPIDDEHTLRIGYLHIRPNEDREWTKLGGSRTLDANRSYDEMQRTPGDYEAQISQRPIAVHELEHLGATDRGVMMFRRQIRDGIRAVAHGKDPKGVVRQVGQVTPTYCQDTVLHIPEAANKDEDDELLRKVGRMVASGQYELDSATLATSDVDPRQILNHVG